MSKFKIFLLVLTTLLFICYIYHGYKFFVELNLYNGIASILNLIIFYDMARWCKEVE